MIELQTMMDVCGCLYIYVYIPIIYDETCFGKNPRSLVKILFLEEAFYAFSLETSLFI